LNPTVALPSKSTSNMAARNLIFPSMMKPPFHEGLFGHSKKLAARSRCQDGHERSPAASARPLIASLIS
jgi:hypothetical protein